MAIPVDSSRFRHLKELGRIAASAIGHSSLAESHRDLKQARALQALHPWHRENKFFFIHIPKAAGTSVRAAIGTPFLEEYPHVKAHSFRQLDKDLFDSSYSFAVIRHPVERFLSAYSHIHILKLYNHDPILLHAPDVLKWPQFLRRFETSHWYRSTIFSALHFQPQWLFVCTPDGQQIVKQLFAFEDMATTMCREVSRRLGRDIQLSTNNVSTREKDGYVLSDKAKQLIMKHYAKDLALYEKARQVEQET